MMLSRVLLGITFPAMDVITRLSKGLLLLFATIRSVGRVKSQECHSTSRGFLCMIRVSKQCLSFLVMLARS
ncbi:unnamed protein product [Brassica oleracea]